MPRQKFSEPKRERKLVRRLAKRWSPGPKGASRIRIEGVVQARKGTRKIAIITCSGSRSDFNDPLFALAKMISDARDPTKQPQPVRELDPTTVTVTPLTESRHTNFAAKRIHHRRMNKIAGRFVTYWPAGPLHDGRFYLYPDKVLYQAFDCQKGWINFKVPEEGVAWPTAKTATKNTPATEKPCSKHTG